VGGILSAESGMFDITAKYDGTHRGICVHAIQDVTFCLKCTLSTPSGKSFISWLPARNVLKKGDLHHDGMFFLVLWWGRLRIQGR
jgi:hypothetical protein